MEKSADQILTDAHRIGKFRSHREFSIGRSLRETLLQSFDFPGGFLDPDQSQSKNIRVVARLGAALRWNRAVCRHFFRFLYPVLPVFSGRHAHPAVRK